MWMLFTRSPAKSLMHATKYDAAVSGANNDIVRLNSFSHTSTTPHTIQGEEAGKHNVLDMRYNGAKQLLQVSKVGPRLKAILESKWGKNPKVSVEPVVQRLFEMGYQAQLDRGLSFGGSGYRPYEYKEQALVLLKFFEEMAALLLPKGKHNPRGRETGETTEIVFETSDLRRAQLEEIALKKSLEDAFPKRTGRYDSLSILHNMGALRHSTSFRDESISLLANKTHIEFDVKIPQIEHYMRSYWNYSFLEGLPKGETYFHISPKDHEKSMDKHRRHEAPKPLYKPGAHWIMTDEQKQHKTNLAQWRKKKKSKRGKRPKAQWTTEYAEAFKDEMHDYVKRSLHIMLPNYKKWDKEKGFKQMYTKENKPSIKRYVSNDLTSNWNLDVDLIVATGHDYWFKKLVKRYRGVKTDHLGNKKPNNNFGTREVWGTKMGDKGTRLDYTEFVLLKWELVKDKLKITELIRPCMTWYGLKDVMTLMEIPDPVASKYDDPMLARYADFGGNFGFEVGGDYDDDEIYDEEYGFGYYDDGEYGYDEDDQYVYDQYDDEQYDYDQDYDYDDDAYFLYEQAAANLKKAKEEFRIAQQLRKWKGRDDDN